MIPLKKSRWLMAVSLILVMGGCTKSNNGPSTTTTGPDPKPVLIRMNACGTGVADPGLHEIKAHASRGARDFVAWYNGRTDAVTITFTDPSPFENGSATIVVQPGKTSEWFRIDKNATVGEHKYDTNPSVHPCPGEGPGEPAVVVDD